MIDELSDIHLPSSIFFGSKDIVRFSLNWHFGALVNLAAMLRSLMARSLSSQEQMLMYGSYYVSESTKLRNPWEISNSLSVMQTVLIQEVGFPVSGTKVH